MGRRPGSRTRTAERAALDRPRRRRGRARALLPDAPDPRRQHRGPLVPALLEGPLPPELSDGAIGALLDRDPADATLPGVSLQAYGGAIADIDDDATAFSHRRTRFEYVAGVKWTDPDEDSLRIGAARKAAAKLDPFAAGAYVNARSVTRAHRAFAAPTPTAKRARLTAVKDAYDPDNVFHLNHNIVPSGHRAP